MKVLGLTGGIASGKSTVARMFAQQGARIFDADKAVHQLMQRGGKAVPELELLFPDAIENGAVNRRILGSYVFNDAQALADLELVLHPLVREAEECWLQHEFRRGTRLAVLEIQLLFETQAELLCDAVAITTAPLWLRKLRAFKRAGMSEEKFAGIIARQMTDDERRHLGDWEITTALGKAVSMQQVKQIVRKI